MTGSQRRHRFGLDGLAASPARLRAFHTAGASLSPSIGRRADRGVSLGGTISLGVAAAILGVASALAAGALGWTAPVVVLAVPAAVAALVAVLWNPRLALLAILATFPLANELGGFGIGPLQPTEAAVFLLAILVGVQRLASGLGPLPWSHALSWALALLAWSSVCLVSALDRGLGVKQVGLLAGGILLACTVMAVCRSLNDVRQILGCFVVVGTAIALVGLFAEGRLETYYGGAVISGRTVGTFQQSNQFGSFTLLAAMAAIGLALGARTRPARLLSGAAASVLMTGVLLSLSRGAWVAAAGGIALLLVAVPRAWRLVRTLIPCLIVAAVLVDVGSSDGLRVLQLRADALTARSPYDYRSLTWQEAAREIADEPVFGQGPGNFRVASLASASGAATIHDEHAHNIWLEWAAGTGIPGAALLLCFVAALAKSIRRAARVARSDRDRAVIVAVGAALLTVLIHGLFDYTLTHDVIWLSVWCLVGLALAAGRVATGGSTVSGSR